MADGPGILITASATEGVVDLVIDERAERVEAQVPEGVAEAVRGIATGPLDGSEALAVKPVALAGIEQLAARDVGGEASGCVGVVELDGVDRGLLSVVVECKVLTRLVVVENADESVPIARDETGDFCAPNAGWLLESEAEGEHEYTGEEETHDVDFEL